MNKHTSYYAVMLRRFFDIYRDLTYLKVPICKHIYFQFLGFINHRWGLKWSEENLDYVRNEIDLIQESEVFDWADEPYPCKANPDGTFLMRGGFGDLAAAHLPIERCFLLSPNQAELDVIKMNRPDLHSHNIEEFYRPNSNSDALRKLTAKCTKLVQESSGDPVFGSPDFLKWLSDKLPDIVIRFEAVQRLIDDLNVAAVLTVSSIHWFCSALNLLARANYIPSITLQHGIITDSQLFCHTPILATKKAIWGESTRQWYQKYGTPSSRLTVTGSPRFDIIFSREWGGRERLLQLTEIDPKYRIAVYTTQPLGGAKIRTVAPIVINGLKTIENLFLLIMLHPNEKPELYQQLAADFPNCRVLRFGTISLYHALSGADLFITCFSTAALEAMHFQLPVVTVEPFEPNFSFGDWGASQVVRTEKELHQVTEQLLTDDEFRKKSIARYQQFHRDFCIPDDSAAKRLINELVKISTEGGIY